MARDSLPSPCPPSSPAKAPNAGPTDTPGSSAATSSSRLTSRRRRPVLDQRRRPSAPHSGARTPRSPSDSSTPTPNATIDRTLVARPNRPPHAVADPLRDHATAYRLIHAEGDALPSLVCDRYDRWLVVQLLSAGLEHFRDDILAALLELTGAEGVLARNDPPVRAREGLARETTLLFGDVPAGDRSTRTRRPVPRRAMDRTEDRRIPRPARSARARSEPTRADKRSTASATTARSRCISRASPTTSRPSTAPPPRSREPPRTPNATALTNIELVEANAFDFLRAQEREANHVRHDRARSTGVREDESAP